MKTLKKLSVILLVVSMLVGFAGCSSDNFGKEAGTYTLRYAANSLPTSWSNHTYNSNDATYITNYTEDSLYTFDYNDAKDGYQIVTSMAAEMPKDVTSEYVGKYGIEEGDTAKVYEIALKHNLKYDNGDVITAKEFVESAKRLLNPKAANFRADNFYSGNLCVYNAEKYLKAGSKTLEDCTGGEGAVAYKGATWTLGADLATIPEDIQKEIYFSSENCYVGKYVINEAGYGDYLVSNGGTYTMPELWAALWSLEYDTDVATEMEGKSLYEILNNESYKAVINFLVHEFWCSVDNEVYSFFCYESEWPELSFDEVGYFAKDDYTLVVVLAKPLSGFYLNYSLCSNMNLVHCPTYDENETITDGVYSNNYATSEKKYVGYGPYKLVSYVSGNSFELQKNEYWHGYTAEEYVAGTYQTTGIKYTQVSEASTRLEMFLKGELESYGLQKEDMDDYAASKYCYYTEGDSTWFIALNPDLAALEEVEGTTEPLTAGNKVVKRIICIKEFRQALSFSVDRAAYQLVLDPTGSPAKALYGNMIICDPDNGTAYRTTDEAKKVIVDFWGLGDAYGEGKEYATIDEAIESITGYDLAGAKELFNTAYDKAVEAGYIPADSDAWEVQIMIGQPGSGSSTYYNNGYTLLSQVWTDAVKGTKLEGHLVFQQSQPLGSSNYSDYLKNNSVDILFGVGWTGSALDPYGLIEAYVVPNYQYDDSVNYKSIYATVEIEGVEYTASAYAWYQALQGDKITAKAADGKTIEIAAGTDADISVRLVILAAIENVVLQQYTMIPVGLDASAALKCMRVKYYTEEYVYGMGRGGVKYMTFTMDDMSWKAYVKEQKGQLNYK